MIKRRMIDVEPRTIRAAFFDEVVLGADDGADHARPQLRFPHVRVHVQRVLRPEVEPGELVGRPGRVARPRLQALEVLVLALFAGPAGFGLWLSNFGGFGDDGAGDFDRLVAFDEPLEGTVV